MVPVGASLARGPDVAVRDECWGARLRCAYVTQIAAAHGVQRKKRSGGALRCTALEGSTPRISGGALHAWHFDKLVYISKP